MHLRRMGLTLRGEEVSVEIDLGKQKLSGLTRWYLGRDSYILEGGTSENLKVMILTKFRKVIDTLFDTIDYPPLPGSNYPTTLSSLMIFIGSNLDCILSTLNGNEPPEIARIFPGKKSIFFSTDGPYGQCMTRNALFYANLRLFLGNFFRERSCTIILEDVIMCQDALQDEESFAKLAKQYQKEIYYFSESSGSTLESEDMKQEGLLTLWSCVKNYGGQNFTPFRAYFLRALRNKKIDLLREAFADKRHIQLHTENCPFGSGETYTEEKVRRAEYASWESEFHTWLNSRKPGGNTCIQPGVAALWDITGKRHTKGHFNKRLDDLFQLCSKHLFGAIEDIFTPEQVRAFYIYHKSGEEILRRIIEEQFGKCDPAGLMNFFRTFYPGRILFDGEKIRMISINPGLQAIFSERVRGYIYYDPMILMHLGMKFREPEIAV